MFIKPSKNGFVYTDTNEPVLEDYADYKCAEDFEKAGVKYIVPMTALEVKEEDQEEMFNAPNIYCETKYDGTRAILHLLKSGNRVFSRRESKETGWLCENTDLVPQFKCLDIKDLDDTIIDGELFIPDQKFSVSSGTMNCLWDKAIYRQYYELGFQVLHAFDIIYYKGENVQHLELFERKNLLRNVIDTLNSEWVEEVPYYENIVTVNLTLPMLMTLEKDREKYPHLFAEVPRLPIDVESTGFIGAHRAISTHAWYEYIVMNGGEGVMLKSIFGRYFNKRTKEYLKVKAFITREVIVIGFAEPTKEYKGKYPTLDKWNYWECDEGGVFDVSDPQQLERLMSVPKDGIVPVSKYFAEKWVGNIIFGVIITKEEKAELLKGKKGKTHQFVMQGGYELIVVGDCSGFSEEVRRDMTDNKENWIGSIIEVKSNEMFRDTGKMRHPRYLRRRFDCGREKCTWNDHIL